MMRFIAKVGSWEESGICDNIQIVRESRWMKKKEPNQQRDTHVNVRCRKYHLSENHEEE